MKSAKKPKKSAIFAENLRKLTEGKNRAAIAKAAGLPANSISDLINKGGWPRLDTASALARALGVDLEWLAHEGPEQECRPLKFVDDDELLLEICKRQMDNRRPFLAAIEEAEKVNWAEFCKSLEGWQPSEPLPKAAENLESLFFRLWVGPSRLTQHDLELFAKAHHEQLLTGFNPGKGNWTAEELTLRAVQDRYEKLRKNRDFLEAIGRIWPAISDYQWCQMREHMGQEIKPENSTPRESVTQK